MPNVWDQLELITDPLVLQETYLSADDLRINLWHMEITDQSFNIVDIKPANMEELTEVITASEFHPKECNLFVYSSSKGTIRLCDMRQVHWLQSGPRQSRPLSCSVSVCSL